MADMLSDYQLRQAFKQSWLFLGKHGPYWMPNFTQNCQMAANDSCFVKYAKQRRIALHHDNVMSIIFVLKVEWQEKENHDFLSKKLSHWFRKSKIFVHNVYVRPAACIWHLTFRQNQLEQSCQAKLHALHLSSLLVSQESIKMTCLNGYKTAGGPCFSKPWRGLAAFALSFRMPRAVFSQFKCCPEFFKSRGWLPSLKYFHFPFFFFCKTESSKHYMCQVQSQTLFSVIFIFNVDTL